MRNDVNRVTCRRNSPLDSGSSRRGNRMPLLTGYVRQRRYAVIRSFVRGDVLDIGCGNMLKSFTPENMRRYVGIDANPALVANMRRLFPQHDFHLCDVDREPLPVHGQRFDTVLLVAVIEHLARPGWILSQIADCLRPAGRLVITTPTPWGLWVHRWGARLGLFHPHAVQQHRHAYDRRSLEALLTAHGFTMLLYRRFEWGANQLVIGGWARR